MLGAGSVGPGNDILRAAMSVFGPQNGCCFLVAMRSDLTSGLVDRS